MEFSKFWTVYCIYDVIHYRFYIGCTRLRPAQRFEFHVSDAAVYECRTQGIFHDYMRQVGIENFRLKIIQQSTESLEGVEEWYIGTYNPHLNIHFRTGPSEETSREAREIAVKAALDQSPACENRRGVFADQRKKWAREKTRLRKTGWSEHSFLTGDIARPEGKWIKVEQRGSQGKLVSVWTPHYEGSATEAVDAARAKTTLYGNL
jgi:hypothetical protein